MNLADRLTATTVDAKGPKCYVCRLFNTLTPADADTLRQALAGSVFTSKQIAEALQAEGHSVQPSSVSRHRRGLCLGTS